MCEPSSKLPSVTAHPTLKERGWRIPTRRDRFIASVDMCAVTAVSAGSDKMQVVQPVIMPLARHAGIVAQSPAHMAQPAMYAPPAIEKHRDKFIPHCGMCAITVGGPWEGRNHGNRTGSLTTASGQAT